ncbi:MAG: GGDEF domain-containing protein [Bacilli bacterium]
MDKKSKSKISFRNLLFLDDRFNSQKVLIISSLIFPVLFLICGFFFLAVDQTTSMLVSFVFCLLYLSLGILGNFDRLKRLNMILMFCLFETNSIYFLIFGEVYFFTPYWIILFAIYSFFILGSELGILANTITQLMLIFFCYIPIGRDIIVFPYYSDTFYLVFPILYCVSTVSGYLFFTNINKKIIKLSEIGDKYQEQSRLDNLTGIYNRYYFDAMIDKHMSDSETKSVGLFILDIDNFKNINDTYGHLFGDEVLKKLAKIIREICGDNTVLCRWGGEEFCVLEFNQTQQNIINLGETLRIMVMNTNFGKESNDVFLTVSIGVCWEENTPWLQKLSLFRNADEALYYVKNSGKNKVMAYSYMLKKTDDSNEK